MALAPHGAIAIDVAIAIKVAIAIEVLRVGVGLLLGVEAGLLLGKP